MRNREFGEEAVGRKRWEVVVVLNLVPRHSNGLQRRLAAPNCEVANVRVREVTGFGHLVCKTE